jgi:hypothetical protein
MVEKALSPCGPSSFLQEAKHVINKAAASRSLIMYYEQLFVENFILDSKFAGIVVHFGAALSSLSGAKDGVGVIASVVSV